MHPDVQTCSRGSTAHCRRCNAWRLPDPSLNTSRPNFALLPVSKQSPCAEELGACHVLPNTLAEPSRLCSHFPRPQGLIQVSANFNAQSCSYIRLIFSYTPARVPVHMNMYTHTHMFEVSVASLRHYGIKLFPELGPLFDQLSHDADQKHWGILSLLEHSLRI